MFEFYYADYNIRGYQIGIPDIGDIDKSDSNLSIVRYSLCNASRFDDESVLVLLSSFGAEVVEADCNSLSRRVVTSVLEEVLPSDEDTPNNFTSNSVRRDSNCSIGILVEVII